MDNNVGPSIIISTHSASVTTLAGFGAFFSNAWATGTTRQRDLLSLWSGQYSQRADFHPPIDFEARFRELFDTSGYDTSSLGGTHRAGAPKLIFTDEAVDQEDDTLTIAININGTNRLRPAAMPMAMVWPGMIPPGKRCEELVSLIDILPTLASVAGIMVGESDEIHADGLNLIPVVLGMSPGHRALFWGIDDDTARVRTMHNLYQVVNGEAQVIDLSTGTLSAVDGLAEELQSAHHMWKRVIAQGWLR